MPIKLTKKNNIKFSPPRSYYQLFLVGIGVVIGVIVTLLVQQTYANNVNPKNKSNTFLTGTVFSSTGGIVYRARVGLLAANQTFTDSQGKYVLEFPNSTFTVVVTYSAKGYQEQAINTSIVKGTTVYQDVTLQKIN